MKWFRNPSIRNVMYSKCKITLISTNKECYLQRNDRCCLCFLKPSMFFEIFLQLFVFDSESNISPLKESTSTIVTTSKKKAFLGWKPISLLWGMLDYYIHIWLPPLVFCRCCEPFCWVLPYKHFPRFCERTIHTCWKRGIWWTIPCWTWPETIPNYSCGKDISWDHTFFHPSRVW